MVALDVLQKSGVILRNLICQAVTVPAISVLLNLFVEAPVKTLVLGRLRQITKLDMSGALIASNNRVRRSTWTVIVTDAVY